MKSIIIVLATYCCMSPVFSTPVPVPVQNNTQNFNSFIHLIAHRQQNIAALIWRVDVPADIAGFEVERSYDGEFFEVIASMDCNNQSMHRYKDTGVFPGQVYYRVKAYLFSGDVIYSDVSLVRIIRKK